MGKITEPTRWILGDKFDTVYGHQGSIAKLWETRWKFVVSILHSRRSNEVIK